MAARSGLFRGLIAKCPNDQASIELQGLKPNAFLALNVAAEAATHKDFFRTALRVCVATGASNGQRLKPFSFRAGCGTVETVPYKDLAVSTRAL
jgi:hypothetical protein